MKVLVDTHVLFWWVIDSRKLSPRARRMIESADNEIAVSAAVAWELATKVRFGKWPEAAPLAASIDEAMQEYGFASLPISLEHARIAGFLPGHHRDPFDRILAAQSQIEAVPLITADRAFLDFGTRVIW